MRLARAVRDAWVILGITCAIAGFLELGYRTQGAIRRALRPAEAAAPRSPYADSVWYHELLSEQDRSLKLEWTPYAYFRAGSVPGRHFRVDALGHRRTVEPEPRPPAQRVVVLGGSAAFGLFQRDEWTIPSQVAGRLAARGADVDVLNLAEPGYVFTQQLLTLVLQLRAGMRPDVVVFYTGFNEVVAAVQAGVGGVPQNEANRSRDFAAGRVLFSSPSGLGGDARVLAALMGVGLHRSELLERLSRRTESSSTSAPSVDSLVATVAGTYTSTAEIADALAQHYGFRTLFVWQPSLLTTSKPLSRYEQAMASGPADVFHLRLKDVERKAVRPVALVMQRSAPGRFVDLSGLFAGDTSTVYLDEVHTTEAANAPIADSLTAHLWPWLDHGARRPVARGMPHRRSKIVY